MVKRAITVLSAAIIAIALVHVVAADDEGMTPGEKFTAGIDRMQEGVDYVVLEGGANVLKDMWCEHDINCNTKIQQCRFVPAGSVCYYCDGANMDSYCIPYPGQDCTAQPGTGLFTCGNEFQAVCTGGTCGPFGTATDELCRPTPCLF